MFATRRLHYFTLTNSVLFSNVLRKAQESQKEMKLLLDMYRSAPKEQRDKVQLMAAEKKAKAEVIVFDVIQSTFCSNLSHIGL